MRLLVYYSYKSKEVTLKVQSLYLWYTHIIKDGGLNSKIFSQVFSPDLAVFSRLW